MEGSVLTQPEVKREREEFGVDFGFTKAAIGDKGSLECVGFASTWVKDRDGERVDPHAFDQTLQGYLSKNPIVLWQHNHSQPLGTISNAEVDEGGLRVAAMVPKPADGEEAWAFTAYNKINAGIVKTFSIGGFFERELRPPADGPMNYDLMDVVITNIDLYEISIVSVPANPDSIFEAAKKAFGTVDPGELLSDRRRMALKQVEQLLGVKALTDPELVGMSEDERKERFEQLIKGWDGIVGFDEFREAEQAYEEGRLLKAAEMASSLMDRLYLPDHHTSKAGRVLSKANESKLRKASDLLAEVLAQVEGSESESAADEFDEKQTVSDASWDGSASRFTDQQWRRSCVLDRGADAGTAKQRYGLPVREPSGTLNRNGVHAAAQRCDSVQAPSEAKTKAAKKLVKLYRGPLKEEPPESLMNMAGMGH